MTGTLVPSSVCSPGAHGPAVSHHPYPPASFFACRSYYCEISTWRPLFRATALMDRYLDTSWDVTCRRLWPARCTVMWTAFPCPGETVTISGSAGIHVGLMFIGVPLASRPEARAATV